MKKRILKKPLIKKILLKEKKTNQNLIKKLKISIVILSLSTIILLSLTTYYLFKNFDKTIESSIGSSVVFEISNNQTQCKSLVYPSATISGLNLYQKSEVLNKTNKELNLIFKIICSFEKNNEIKNVAITCNTNKATLKDDYYILNIPIKPNEKIQLFDKIISPKNFSKTKYSSISICVTPTI